MQRRCPSHPTSKGVYTYRRRSHDRRTAGGSRCGRSRRQFGQNAVARLQRATQDCVHKRIL